MMTPANRAARQATGGQEQAGRQQTPLGKLWDFASGKSNATAILTTGTVGLVFVFAVTYMARYDPIAQHLPTMIMKNVKTEPAFPDTQIVSLMKERKRFLKGQHYFNRSGLFLPLNFIHVKFGMDPKILVRARKQNSWPKRSRLSMARFCIFLIKIGS
eukprot:gb/GECG01010856.1/.p1 GENE.gb/GECG01010856.1/~~gb/GECG01010856.1/.p1  ORF type:complete len:158 (+),score=9.10 gb/GECG01010856.1/:1-474(+)